MKNKIGKFIYNYFVTGDLLFESRILNFACFFSASACILALISRIVASLPFITMIPLLIMIVAISCVFITSIKKAKYASLLTTLTVCGVSVVFWPFLFFTIGGPRSGMAVYFALAIILDFALLKGKSRVIAAILTCVVTFICYASTLFWGVGILLEHELSDFQLFIDILQSIFIVGFLMGIIIQFQTRLYKNEKIKADTADIKRNESLVQLELAQNTMSAMFWANPHTNILFNDKFQIIDCNPTAMRLVGFDTKEEMIAGFTERITKGIPEYQSSGQRSIPLPERFMTVMKEGSVKFETNIVLQGVEMTLDVEFKQIPYGDTFAVVGYVFDMTNIHKREMELKLRDQQLREAVAEAEAANRAKSTFLSTMSHEIRTPMNAILGIAEIQLQNETLDKSTREAIGKIYNSGDMLLGIINDILDLSKIESGKLEILIDKYEIASLISDAVQLNMMRIGSKPIEFELHVKEDMPVTLLGDELRVKQILNNILSNAFKYTSAGLVTLSVATESAIEDDSHEILILSVSDTGQGMTKEQVERIFDAYTRFNVEANRSAEGTGLGMSITRNLIKLMGGDISVESEPGKGSTFVVHIPQGAVGPERLGKDIAENLQQFRTSSRAQMKRVQISREPMPYGSVLIVDDVETNIYVAKGLLAPYALKIDSADSGPVAINKIKRGKVYDIIFMDHMMPQMDGIEATKIIRDLGYDRPIVALTANAVSGQAEMFIDNGFDEFISKPIDVRQLNTVLNKLVRDKQPPEVIEAARQQSIAKKNQDIEDAANLSVNTQFADAFVRDARKSIAVLDEVMKKTGEYDDEDIRMYTVHVHGMKSALANIGQKDLSDIALKLEAQARNKDMKTALSETQAFLDSLRKVVETLTPEVENENVEMSKEDQAFLSEKLVEVREACLEYDKKAARNLLAEIREKTWPQDVNELLDTIAENLLHSGFDEIVSAIEKYN